MSKNFLIILSLFLSKTILSELPEMVIGKETIDPRIEIIFEGAIKDDVSPVIKFVSIDQSDIHLEVLANWNEYAPSGSPVGGFVAYLNISAEIINQSTSRCISD